MEDTATCDCGCSLPSRGEASTALASSIVDVHAHSRAQKVAKKGFVAIPAGTFLMGTNAADGYPDDGEGPIHTVRLDSFQVAMCTVTNKEFGKFVKATSYQTDAEKYGWSFVFSGLLPDDFPPTRAVAETPWWRQVFGAMWSQPEGPQSNLKGRAHHPVTHVSWNDALAYCDWFGGRLPTEAEWEYTARGGMEQTRYPWGDEREPDGAHRMNVWQGEFPASITEGDGFYGTAPVDSFIPNGYGLYNMTGNVWEWCSDWFDPGYYNVSPESNPRGPESGKNKVMRGGSFLCHESYCFRYRVDARSSNSIDASTSNLGFRVVFDETERGSR